MSIEQYLELLRQRLENIPFHRVIELTTGCKVLPLLNDDVMVIDEMFDTAREVVRWAAVQNFAELRPNEICNRLEAELRRRLRGSIPEGKTAGYPDILIERGTKSYYVEVKLAGTDQLHSSLRTFYYQPMEPAKIRRDACHILVGFIHRKRRVVGFKIIDLYGIRVSLKNEFNTNNAELYRDRNIIRRFP